MSAFRVYVDSNSLWGDPLLSKATLGQRLLRYVAEGKCQLHLSPVVIGELSRRELTELNQHYAELETRIKSIGSVSGDTSELLEPLRSFTLDAEKLLAERYQQLVADGGVFIQPWPVYSGEAMVKRELDMRRPFLRKEVGTIGHRDTVIWLGLIELAVSFPDDTIIFVTNDDGFKQKKQLHPDLLADLTAQGVGADRIKLYQTIYPLLEFLKEAPSSQVGTVAPAEHFGEEAAETLDIASWRAVITQALWEYNDTLKDLSWAPSPDPQDGGYFEPDWDIGLPVEFEDAQLTAIDGPFEVSIAAERPILDERVKCTHQVVLSFTGMMSKFSWYGREEDDDLELFDSDWNDTYMLVGATRTIELTTTVLYDGPADEASVETLDSVTVVLPRLGAVFARLKLPMLDKRWLQSGFLGN